MPADGAELRIRSERRLALSAGDDRRRRADRPPAIRAEVRSPDERRPARAASGRSRAARRHGRGEERVELLQPVVESEELVTAIDEEVLKRAAKRTEGQEKRDRLFDIIMTRFDVLGPHKAALKSIYASGAADVSLAVPYLSSQHWMLEAAGIGTDGPAGTIKVAGLGMAYAWVFRTWLDDDDPGLAKTMAALDRRLRRGERALGSIEHLNAAVSRFAAGLGELGRSVAGKRKKSNPPADPEVGQV